MVEIDVTNKFLNELKIATEKVLSLYNVSPNTDLSESIEWQYKNDMFVLIANDYFQYVSTGRRKRARKVPIEDLIKWIKQKGISPRPSQTINQLAYAFQNAIYKNGIKAKNYINPVVDITTDIIAEALSIQLSEEIATEIANDITKNNLK